jgi:2-methylcitrate dehydratase PrpD
MEAVRKLAAYVTAAREQPLAPEARQAACRCILDLVAAAAAGADAPGPEAVRRTAFTVFAAGDHPVWFTGARTGLAGAAWCNSAAAAALDLDDGNRLARGHPGAAVIPAAFAAAQEVGASTETLLQAIVVGYEVGVAVGASRRFYANTGMWSCYGVVAAVGFLRGTPPEQLAHAFAIAGMSAPNQLHVGAGPTQVFPVGSDVKEGIPWSTLTAINAVLLAEAGTTGPLNVLDGEAHFAPEELADLGGRLHICGTYFKFQSCCRHVHAPVDALCGLIERYGLDPRAIDAVEVHSYSGALRLANPPEPANLVDIQFSIPYCLGLAALLGPGALLPLTSDALGRSDASTFARKVTLVLDPELDRAFPAQTLTRVVLSSGGRRYESPVTAPRGEASDPPTWSELEDKLRSACRFVAPAETLSALLAAIRRLPNGDHQPLMRALADLRLGRT